MKKLMIAAAAVAVAGGAFADAIPQVYEYKAALKNMTLKETKVTLDKVPYIVYMKTMTSTTLKGWLIMDSDGVTSPTIMNDRLGHPFKVEGNYADVPKDVFGTNSTGFDYGRNRGFLVVINPKAYKSVRSPKILPAVLDGKWIDTAFTKNHTAQSGLAEGYLYVGGDAVQPVRPQLDVLDSNPDYSTQREDIPYVPTLTAGLIDDGSGNQTLVTTNYSGMVAIGDYVWTSVYLFAGSTEKDAFFNGPNWFKPANVSPFGMFEFAWDQNLPNLLQTGWATNEVSGYKTPVNYYHDTWMNGSGIGKWSKAKDDGDYCCGIFDDVSYEAPLLDTLSGNLKGGLFLCTENGIDAKSTAYMWLGGYAWEDQFNTARLEPAVLFAPDVWQNDLWQDGFFEIETTDVIYGTWSIKRATSKFYAKKNPIWKALTDSEVATLKDYTQPELPYEIITTATVTDKSDPSNPQEVEKTIGWLQRMNFTYDEYLWGAINGAALNLAKTSGGSVTVFDGSEIYSKTVKNRAKLPMVTPQFALYYRLVYGSNYYGTIQ